MHRGHGIQKRAVNPEVVLETVGGARFHHHVESRGFERGEDFLESAERVGEVVDDVLKK